MSNKQLIMFATHLSPNLDIILDVIFSRLADSLEINYFDGETVKFLQCMESELKPKWALDVFNNKYINYTTTKNPVCCIPSRFYKFDQNVADCKAVLYKVSEDGLRNNPAAKCSISVPSCALKSSLEILLKIQEKMQVTVSSFAVLEDYLFKNGSFVGFAKPDERTAYLLKNTIQLDEGTTVFGIRNFHLSEAVFNSIVQQLRGCTNMEVLCLSDVQQNIPRTLANAIATLSSLKIANLQFCRMTKQSCKALLLEITTCSQLIRLDMSDSVLTDCLEYLLGVANSGFPCLEGLILENTRLSRKDLTTISKVVRQTKLPSLRVLTLSKNSLTDCIAQLVPVRGGCRLCGYLGMCLGLPDTK